MRKGIAWLVIVTFSVTCSWGCATTVRQTRQDALDNVDTGLKAAYWGTYVAGKALEAPKIASGPPAPSMAFEAGIGLALIPIALLIKLGKSGKGKTPVNNPETDKSSHEGNPIQE